jgi:Na+/melibiose symporter-like transporter
VTPFRLSRRGAPRNVPFAFLSGVLIALTEILLHPTIILVFFVSQLTDSLKTIALVVTVGLIGWYVPQLITPWLAKSSGRQMPWALGASLVRAASVIFLAYVGYRTDISDAERLRSFFICYVAYSVAAGFAHAPFNELVARGVQGDQLGRLITLRNLWSGLLAVAAGFVARQALGPDGPAFPRNLTLLFIAAAASVSGATFFLARIREPQIIHPMGAAGPTPHLRDLAQVLGDGAFRRYALFGAIGAVATLADPFYVVYAQREFNLPADVIGTFLIVFAAGALAAAPLWTMMSRLGGARGAMQSATAIRVIAPLVLLFLPYLVDTDLYREHVHNERMVFYILAVPFAVQGIALRGFVNGNFRYVMDIAVPERRIAYQMLALSPLVVAAIAPLAGAEIANRWGFDRLFLVAVFAGFIAILSGGMLANTSMRVRSVSRAWRLHDARS